MMAGIIRESRISEFMPIQFLLFLSILTVSNMPGQKIFQWRMNININNFLPLQYSNNNDDYYLNEEIEIKEIEEINYLELEYDNNEY